MSWSILIKLKSARNKLLDQAELGFGIDSRQLQRLKRLERLIKRYGDRK